jgi:hypothetical protein
MPSKFWDAQHAMADLLGIVNACAHEPGRRVVEQHGRLRRIRVGGRGGSDHQDARAGTHIDVWSPPAGKWAVVMHQHAGLLKVYPDITTASYQLQLQRQQQQLQQQQQQPLQNPGAAI